MYQNLRYISVDCNQIKMPKIRGKLQCSFLQTCVHTSGLSSFHGLSDQGFSSFKLDVCFIKFVGSHFGPQSGFVDEDNGTQDDNESKAGSHYNGPSLHHSSEGTQFSFGHFGQNNPI